MNDRDRSFDVYARETTIRHCTRLGVVVVVAALLLWPLDLWLFPGPENLRAFTLWRLGSTVVTGLGIVTLRSLRAPFRGTYAVALAAMSIDSALVGYAGALTGPLAERFLMVAPLVTISSIVLLVSFPLRVAATVALSACYVVPLVAFNTEAWPSGLLTGELGLTVFAGVVSLVFGHTHYRLALRSHAQQVALDQRSRELEELDRMKNDFFANVSHELRTPLTLILAMLRELRASDDTDTRARVDTAERNAARLLVLIDELLELARFTGGGAEPKKRRIDLALLARDVTASFRASDGSGVTLSGCERTRIVHADPRQLRTALYNLLSNAHKFTEPETRAINVTLEALGDRVELSVTDNGVGIPSAARDRVFERFFQVDAGRGRSRGGAGIGLALVRDVALAHGGDVRVESAVGRGSTFTITIPIGAPTITDELASFDGDELAALHRIATAAPLPPPRAEISEVGETILVAEDDPELRAYIERLLGSRYRVLSASNGEQALACLEEASPALVVTDAMMPGTSGFDLARELRARAETARLPVLFLTARTGAGARAEAYEAGADDFLNKPFEPEELLARVKNLLDLRATERELAATNERLEQKVAERTAELRDLAYHLEKSREDERRRIARDLHDETGQLLTALRMELDLARGHAREPELAMILERMDAVLDQAFEATRALVGELRPRILDDLGLGAAAEWYLARFRARSALACDVDVDAELIAAVEPSTAAFRILQETLTNVTRHSGASSVRVRLARDGEHVVLEVADDGRGFDPSSTRAGYGLLGMRERVAALGGELTIESGRGTRVAVRLPIEARLP